MADTYLHGVEVIDIDDGVRPIRTLSSSVIGLVGTAPDADVQRFPLNTPVLVTSLTQAAALGKTGTLMAAIDDIYDQASAVIVLVRVEASSDDMQSFANVIGGVDETTGHYQGLQALRSAKSLLGVQPRILIAPGFTHQRPVDPDDEQRQLANPVVAELIGVAQRLRAVIIADAPNTHDADAIAYRQDWGSQRVYVIDPFVKVLSGAQIVSRPASARVAGLIANTDQDKGFWFSPSNQNINGILGTHRAVDFALGDATSRANLLNAKEVATIIYEDGYRLWGNRTCSSDPKWAFLSVVRTADMINDSLLRAHLWAVDRNITKTYVEEVIEGVNAYLRQLKAQGAILGGRCWADPELNSPMAIADGKVYFDFDFTPPFPAEHITFRSHLVNNYMVEILAK